MSRIARVLAAASALVGSSAYGQALGPPPPVPHSSTANRHLGFALRLDGGPGYISSTDSLYDTTMKGGSGAFGLVVGGAVAENLILGADIWGITAFSPTISQGTTSVSTGNVSVSLTGIGLNATYYLMPANVYLSLSPSISRLSLTIGGVSASTKNGFGMKMALGKEWWVGDHWGLGAAAQFFLASNEDQGTSPPTWSSRAFAIAFSATYN